MAEPHWFDPRTVEFKISPILDLKPVHGGDWDIERRSPLARNIKHMAIVQRFVQGMAWEETDLFRDIYARRLAGGGCVRGESTIEALAQQYYERVDGMFEDMRANGFRLNRSDGQPHPLPNLLVGRRGDLFLGNNGNHRFAMALVLGLERIAGEIICRHKSIA